MNQYFKKQIKNSHKFIIRVDLPSKSKLLSLLHFNDNYDIVLDVGVTLKKSKQKISLTEADRNMRIGRFLFYKAMRVGDDLYIKLVGNIHEQEIANLTFKLELEKEEVILFDATVNNLLY